MRPPSGLLAATAAIITLCQVCFAEQRETSDNKITNRNGNGRFHNIHYDHPVRSHLSYETANPQDRIYTGSREGKEGFLAEDGGRRRDERVCASWHPALQFPPHTQQYPSPPVPHGPQYSQYSLPSQQYPPPVRPVPNDERNYDPRGYPFSPDYHHHYRGPPIGRHQMRAQDIPGPMYMSYAGPQMYSPHRMDNQYAASAGPSQAYRHSASDPHASQPTDQGSHASVTPETAAKTTVLNQNKSQHPSTNDIKTPVHTQLDHSQNSPQDQLQKHPKLQNTQPRDEHISSPGQKSEVGNDRHSESPILQHSSDKNNTDETYSKDSHARESHIREYHARDSHAGESRAKDPQPDIYDPQFQYQNNFYRPDNWGQPPIFAPQFFDKPAYSEYNKPYRQ